MNKQLLNSMYRRRMSCSEAVQQLWDAVKVIRHQRQVPNVERIAKYMKKYHLMSEEEVIRQLGHCVRDKLLFTTTRKGSKGSKVGVEQEAYKLPDKKADRDKHDWYCSQCHLGGDVVPCGACHRVYHLSCVSNIPGTEQKYQCSVCQAAAVDTLPNIKQRQLNEILFLISMFLKDKFGELMNASEFLQRSVTIGNPGSQIDIGSESWRLSYLIHQNCDLARMLAKAKDDIYTNLSQFKADAATIVHNVTIFQGVNSSLADTARQMARDCFDEIKLVQLCHACYRSSSSKKRGSTRKFTAPCRPPHELVYAKSKDALYWPAKVLGEDGEKLEKLIVCFFGAQHLRASVSKANVVPITTNLSNLQSMKRNSSWNKACDELKTHQELLRRLEEGTYESAYSSDSDESVTSMKSLKSETTIKSEQSLSSSVSLKPTVLESKKPKKSTKSRDSSTGLGKFQDSKSEKDSLKLLDSSSDDERVSDNFFHDLLEKNKSNVSVKKKRGRPSLKKEEKETPPKKKRGRPPKKPKEDESPEKVLESVVKDEEKEESVDQDKDAINQEIIPQDTEKTSFSIERQSLHVKTDKKQESSSTVVEPELQEIQKYSGLPTSSPNASKNEEEIVSSSCMEPQVRSIGMQTKHDSKKDRANKELIAKLREELEEMKTRHKDEIKQAKEKHAQEVASTKKKQWCYNCEQEAIYHCCWNTAYCSTECQQHHWQREHKRVCRRKR